MKLNHIQYSQYVQSHELFIATSYDLNHHNISIFYGWLALKSLVFEEFFTVSLQMIRRNVMIEITAYSEENFLRMNFLKIAAFWLLFFHTLLKRHKKKQRSSSLNIQAKQIEVTFKLICNYSLNLIKPIKRNCNLKWTELQKKE